MCEQPCVRSSLSTAIAGGGAMVALAMIASLVFAGPTYAADYIGQACEDIPDSHRIPICGGVPDPPPAPEPPPVPEPCVYLLNEYCVNPPDPPPVPPTPEPCVNLLLEHCVGPPGIRCEAAGSVDLKTGDLVVDVGVGAEVPPPAEGVTAQMFYLTGSEILGIEHRSDGSVVISDCGADRVEDQPPPPPSEGPPPASSDPSADPAEDKDGTSPRACRDDAFDLHRGNYRWNETYHYRFNGDTTPGELSPSGAEAAIREGTAAIPSAVNTCNEPDDITATQSFDGRTNQRANIDRAQCVRRDGSSVADFGGSVGEAVAGTCVWDVENAGIDRAVESDLRLNKQGELWTTNTSGTCSGRYIVRAVTVHERGHTYGLQHVGEKNHGNLTMGAGARPCDNTPYTLGLGDLIGLNRLY